MLAVSYPVPPNDAVRCASVRTFAAPAQQSCSTKLLDNMVAETAAFFGVPICLISLVDKDVQHFVGAFGLAPGLRETGRDISFCAHAIMPDAPEVLVIDDASLDARFSANPLVTGYPRVRFYAGAPLIHPTTHSRLGTLCIIDGAPRQLSSEQRLKLQQAAAHVVSVLHALAQGGLGAMPILPIKTMSTVLGPDARGASSPPPPPPRPVIPVRGLMLEVALSSDQLHAALRRYCGQQQAVVRAVDGEHCLRVLLPARAASAEAEATNAVEMSMMIFEEMPAGGDEAASVVGRDEAMDGSSSTAARVYLHVRRLSGDALAFGQFYRGMRTEIS